MMRHLVVFLALFGVTSIFATSARPDSRTPAEAMVEEYYSRFQRPGFLVDDLMQYYADGVRFTDPTFDIVAHGKDEVRRLYADLGTGRTSYRDIQWRIRTVVSQGDYVVIRGRWSGSFHDCEFDVDFVTIWRLEAGKIIEQDDFFSAGTFDRQVGWNGETATCAAAPG